MSSLASAALRDDRERLERWLATSDYRQAVVTAPEEVWRLNEPVVDLLLELTVLISNVLNKLAKLLIVEDHPQDDGFVDIDRGKFVRVALIDNLSDFREMFRDFWSTLLDY